MCLHGLWLLVTSWTWFYGPDMITERTTSRNTVLTEISRHIEEGHDGHHLTLMLFHDFLATEMPHHSRSSKRSALQI